MTTIPTTWTIRYEPELSSGHHCGCGEIIGAVRIIDCDTDQPLCTTCMAGHPACQPYATLVDALDEVDQALHDIHPNTAELLAADAVELLPQIITARVPAGRRPKLPDHLFLPALLDRLVVGGTGPQDTLRVIAQVAPDLNGGKLREIFEANRAEAAAASDAARGDAHRMQAALILMDRAQDPANVRDAVAQFGIDFDIYITSLLDAAAERECEVSELPRAVVDDAMAAAGCPTAPGEPYPSIAGQ